MTGAVIRKDKLDFIVHNQMKMCILVNAPMTSSLKSSATRAVFAPVAIAGWKHLCRIENKIPLGSTERLRLPAAAADAGTTSQHENEGQDENHSHHHCKAGFTLRRLP